MQNLAFDYGANCYLKNKERKKILKKEMQIKTTIRFQLTSARIALKNKIPVVKDVEELKHSYVAGRNVKGL